MEAVDMATSNEIEDARRLILRICFKGNCRFPNLGGGGGGGQKRKKKIIGFLLCFLKKKKKFNLKNKLLKQTSPKAGGGGGGEGSQNCEKRVLASSCLFMKTYVHL